MNGTVTPEISASSFSDFMDYAAFSALVAETEAFKDHNVYHDILNKSFAPVLRQFLETLRSQNRLHPVQGGEGHSIRFLTHWNDMMANLVHERDFDERYMWQYITYVFMHDYLSGATRPIEKYIDKNWNLTERLPEIYRKFIADITAGNIGERGESSRDHYCSMTDVTYRLQMKNWQPVLGKRNADDVFVPLKPAPVQGIEEIKVEFRTSEILIADWFRIPEFTKAVNTEGDERLSINSSAGCVEATRRYIDKHGFISVSVGNTSPRVLSFDGTLIFGNVSEDIEDDAGSISSPGVTELGSTCTDLWWVTIIERERLTEIIAAETGRAEAEQKVAEYLAEDHYGLTVLNIEPGNHYLYFKGRTRDFADEFRSPDLLVPDGVEPKFILSSRALEYGNKPDFR